MIWRPFCVYFDTCTYERDLCRGCLVCCQLFLCFFFQELVLPLFWIYCSSFFFFTVSVHVIIVDIDCILQHSISSCYSSCTLWQVNSECVFMDKWIVVPREIHQARQGNTAHTKLLNNYVKCGRCWLIQLNWAIVMISSPFFVCGTAASDLHRLHLRCAGMHRQSKGVDWLLLVFC